MKSTQAPAAVPRLLPQSSIGRKLGAEIPLGSSSTSSSISDNSRAGRSALDNASASRLYSTYAANQRPAYAAHRSTSLLRRTRPPPGYSTAPVFEVAAESRDDFFERMHRGGKRQSLSSGSRTPRSSTSSASGSTSTGETTSRRSAALDTCPRRYSSRSSSADSTAADTTRPPHHLKPLHTGHDRSVLTIPESPTLARHPQAATKLEATREQSRLTATRATASTYPLRRSPIGSSETDSFLDRDASLAGLQSGRRARAPSPEQAGPALRLSPTSPLPSKANTAPVSSEPLSKPLPLLSFKPSSPSAPSSATSETATVAVAAAVSPTRPATDLLHAASPQYRARTPPRDRSPPTSARPRAAPRAALPPSPSPAGLLSQPRLHRSPPQEPALPPQASPLAQLPSSRSRILDLDSDEPFTRALPPTAADLQRPRLSNSVLPSTSLTAPLSAASMRADSPRWVQQEDDVFEDTMSATLPVGGGRCGLRNLGNTCFINAVIQCLAHTPRLCQAFFSPHGMNVIDTHLAPAASYKSQGWTGGSLTTLDPQSWQDRERRSSRATGIASQFAALLAQMWQPTSGSLHTSGQYPSGAVVAPTALKAHLGRFAPQFSDYQQQDAQELLSYLLDALHEDLNQGNPKLKLPALEGPEWDQLLPSSKAKRAQALYSQRHDSVIQRIFGGWLRSTLTCTVCRHSSLTFDPVLGISLPLPHGRRASQVDLQSCFEAFVAPEVLDGDERPTCERCKARTRCTKALSLEVLPPVLVVHLKRFEHMAYRSSKITTPVNYPLRNLNLAPYCSPDRGSALAAYYRLCGVTKHMGSLGGGHYTAVCRDFLTDDWFNFNDAMVSPTSASSAQCSDAYLLFYERTD